MKSRVSIPCEKWTEPGSPECHFATAFGLAGSSWVSMADARRKLADWIQRTLEGALAAREHHARIAIGCRFGEVLLISWSHAGGYECRIVGPDRERSSSVLYPPADSLERVAQHTREHAEQCYGGVAWETRY